MSRQHNVSKKRCNAFQTGAMIHFTFAKIGGEGAVDEL